MKLSDVIEGLKPVQIKGSGAVEISGICHDSRHFQPGDLFVAIRGNQFDGHMFVPNACDNGAPAVVVEDDRVVPMRYSGSVIKAKDTRRAIDCVASNFYGRPSEKLFVAGVTGTNGKTTTAYMIETLLNAHKMKTAVIGTIDTHLGEKKYQSSHTTPDALGTQKLLSIWQKEGAKAVSMEVSSHALALSRVDSVHFDVAVFTNLTRDHLDFHKTMDEYIKAKGLFFHQILKKSAKKNKRAIMNAEDPHFKQLYDSAVPTWTYGFEKGDIRACKMELTFHGTKFEMTSPQGKTNVELPMIGRHNVLNALAAFGVGIHLGFDPHSLSQALSGLRGVKGRMERVSGSSPVHVFVDYAHSDDALKNVLSFLKNIREELASSSRIITVFGCGGDRDKGKRPLMMQVAQNFSDLTIVTSDNPRTEDPEGIVDEILGAANPALFDPLKGEEPRIFKEVDRRKAIELALKKARPGDVVLIAGKGHENYQIIGTKKLHFDDAETAKEIFSKMKTWSIEEIAEGTEGTIEQKGTLEATGVSIDTRKDLDRKIFFALKGENFDGHEFAGAAVEKGVAVLIVDKKIPRVSSDTTVIKVENTLQALQKFGHWHRKRWVGKLVGLTGSNGKTTTKEFCQTILSQKFPTLATKGNLNNHVGVPLTLLELRPEHKFAIIEMGMNHAGEIATLTQMCAPDIALVTNVGRAHIEHFGSIEAIARAKEEIYENAPAKATRIYNLDNQHTGMMRARAPGGCKVYTYSSHNRDVDVSFKEKVLTLDYVEIQGVIGKDPGQVKIPSFGRQQVANAMAASCVALACGLDAPLIWKGLGQCRSSWGRGQVVDLESGAKVLFDAYNANPDSAAIAFENFAKLSCRGKKYVVFGDMLELGSISQSAHQEVGQTLSDMGLEGVLIIGARARDVESGLRSKGFKKTIIISDAYEEKLATSLGGVLETGDMVLVKGSRGMHLERVVECFQPQNFDKNTK